MSEVRAFFRHCPACGRRFEIRVVKREVRDGDLKESEMPRADGEIIGSPSLEPLTTPIIELGVTEPTLVEQRAFTYSYRCKHCGHQWTETHAVDHVEPRPESYTGD